MNNTKLIADLCAIIDRQNVIIQATAMALAQYDALTAAEREATDAARRDYAETMGEVAP